MQNVSAESIYLCIKIELHITNKVQSYPDNNKIFDIVYPLQGGPFVLACQKNSYCTIECVKMRAYNNRICYLLQSRTASICRPNKTKEKTMLYHSYFKFLIKLWWTAIFDQVDIGKSCILKNNFQDSIKWKQFWNRK